jgi:hypothetical protein
MPRLRINLDDRQLNEEALRQCLLNFASDDNPIRFVKAIGRLMKDGDLTVSLSPRLMRKLRAFATEKSGTTDQGGGEVDDTLFLSWLDQVGSVDPKVQWDVEALSEGSEIYRMLLKGGRNGEGVHDNQS